MGLYLPNRSKYGVASAPGTSTTITLGTLVPGFLPLPNAASGFPVVYYAEDTIGGSAVCEIGDATLTLSGSTWTLTNRNPYEQSNGTTSLLSLTSAALIGFSMRAGDFFGFAAGFVNKFRNPIFDIWQRGSSITVTTSGAYTADGWIVQPTGASVTVTQDATRSNDENLLALKIAGAASVTDVKLIQRIESFIAAPLAGKTCTVKFKVYNGKASGSLTPTLKLDHASAVDNFGAVSNDLAATNLQVCANGAWTTVAYTFTAGVNVINGMQVTLDVGALGSGDYVEVTSADNRETPFVATGLCATPPLTEKRPIHAELQFSQRYYEVEYSVLDAGSYYALLQGATAAIWAAFNFRITKRAPPTFAILLGAWASAAPDFGPFITTNQMQWHTSSTASYVSNGTTNPNGAPMCGWSCEL